MNMPPFEGPAGAVNADVHDGSQSETMNRNAKNRWGGCVVHDVPLISKKEHSDRQENA
jgi:hypothetical protein